MKIALFGATGMIGQRILTEALHRGHEVTAVLRNPAKLEVENPNLTRVQGDIFNPESVAGSVMGNDVIISAYGPGLTGDPAALQEATRTLIEGVEETGIPRLIVVGGAGSLEVAPGVHLVDAPGFPDAWKPIALAHRDAFDLFRANTTLDWSYVSPAAMIEPGERTGAFRIGGDQLLTDMQGNSRISAEDFAIALLDEAEKPQHIRERFTVAY